MNDNSETRTRCPNWMQRLVRFVWPESVIPAAGEEWRIISEDPFPPKNVSVIIDVKDGWVRYRIGRSMFAYYDDERMKIESFVRIYEKHKPSNSEDRHGVKA